MSNPNDPNDPDTKLASNPLTLTEDDRDALERRHGRSGALQRIQDATVRHLRTVKFVPPHKVPRK